MGEGQWGVWSRRGVVQGCPRQVWAARLAQQVQTWVAAVTEKRDKSPILQEQQSGESWTGTAQGTYGTEIFFPHISVWSLLGAGPSEEIPHHSHEQPALCLPGENGMNRARGDQGLGEIMTERKDFLAVLETTLRATSLVTTPVCGDGMRTRAS